MFAVFVGGLAFSCAGGMAPSQEVAFRNATADDFDIGAVASAFDAAREIPDLRSLPVARDFEILAEVFRSNTGPGPDSVLHVMSVTKSVTPKVASGDHIPQYPQYGHLWWLKSNNGHDCSCAIGYGGQYTLVCPDVNLVVVATTEYRGLTAQEAGANWEAVGRVIDGVLAAVR